jgi:hypothetical protein
VTLPILTGKIRYLTPIGTSYSVLEANKLGRRGTGRTFGLMLRAKNTPTLSLISWRHCLLWPTDDGGGGCQIKGLHLVVRTPSPGSNKYSNFGRL